ncbi:MFS transporter [Herbaspirillum sp. RTI4]|uniref:MFS transporter n=1 Tax=Herbaspirillum sp. RTI4 TaxID=3048640 RepID=UPI002AB4B173|nr:MFS transporter [Herbaspirillum sp. RTI4]MDY7577008.1 MFS transporter [Herbaspirillum sp. RTI4]MEA9983079.1 MFS transporter [Herbaspirillum sp. RTI4]
MTTSPALSLRALFSYGLFGFPLAMVALPIYIFVPQFYAQRSGLTLATIGLALLVTRLFAALTDPLLGWWVQRGGGAYTPYLLLSLPLLLLGFGALFHPPELAKGAVLAWFIASLLLVYLGFGLAMITHQSWGAALTQAPLQRTRVAAIREGCGLAGVVITAGLSGWMGYDALSLAFAVCLLLSAMLLLRQAPRPAASANSGASAALPLTRASLLTPFASKPYRALFAVLIVNGVAAAIPATLFLFFADDKLQLGKYAGAFLVLYFIAAAASMPLWVALARCWGEARAWVAGMLLSALVFVWAFALGAGALYGFGAICLLSGIALGADLALPPALLAGVISRAGHSGQREAAYFGWWNWGVQMTLALAAGISLPLLEWLGYVPGQSGGVPALSVAYALLPCGLKLIAAAMLWRAPLRDC